MRVGRHPSAEVRTHAERSDGSQPYQAGRSERLRRDQNRLEVHFRRSGGYRHAGIAGAVRSSCGDIRDFARLEGGHLSLQQLRGAAGELPEIRAAARAALGHQDTLDRGGLRPGGPHR